MEPSRLLSAAADRLRDLAAAAAPGPWEIDGTSLFGGVNRVASGIYREGNARWVAALSPAVAPHLEAWLREEAKQLAEIESGAWAAYLNPYRPSTRLARLLCPELVEEDQK